MNKIHLLICFMLVTCLVTFGKRLNSFTSSELQKDSQSSRLIDATQTINSCVLRTDNGPQLWHKFPTPLYRKLEKATKVLEEYVLLCHICVIPVTHFYKPS